MEHDVQTGAYSMAGLAGALRASNLNQRVLRAVATACSYLMLLAVSAPACRQLTASVRVQALRLDRSARERAPSPALQPLNPVQPCFRKLSCLRHGQHAACSASRQNPLAHRDQW